MPSDFRFVEGKTKQLILLFLAAAVAFYFVSDNPFGQQVFCFPVGVMLSQLEWRRPLKYMATAGKILLCAGLLVLAVGMYLLRSILGPGMLLDGVCAVMGLSAAAFIFLGVYYAKAVPIFGIFVPVGYIAYALYLLYRPVFVMLSGFTDKYLLVVLLILVAVSAVFSWLCFLMVNFNSKMRRRRKTHLKGSMW